VRARARARKKPKSHDEHVRIRDTFGRALIRTHARTHHARTHARTYVRTHACRPAGRLRALRVRKYTGCPDRRAIAGWPDRRAGAGRRGSV